MAAKVVSFVASVRSERAALVSRSADAYAFRAHSCSDGDSRRNDNMASPTEDMQDSSTFAPTDEPARHVLKWREDASHANWWRKKQNASSCPGSSDSSSTGGLLSIAPSGAVGRRVRGFLGACEAFVAFRMTAWLSSLKSRTSWSRYPGHSCFNWRHCPQAGVPWSHWLPSASPCTPHGTYRHSRGSFWRGICCILDSACRSTPWLLTTLALVEG